MDLELNSMGMYPGSPMAPLCSMSNFGFPCYFRSQFYYNLGTAVSSITWDCQEDWCVFLKPLARPFQC